MAGERTAFTNPTLTVRSIKRETRRLLRSRGMPLHQHNTSAGLPTQRTVSSWELA